MHHHFRFAPLHQQLTIGCHPNTVEKFFKYKFVKLKLSGISIFHFPYDPLIVNILQTVLGHSKLNITVHKSQIVTFTLLNL